MTVIGLTGGIASGKSTVSQLLAKMGLPIIDADLIAHQLQCKGEPVLKELVAAFGPHILNEQGELERRKLGEIIFNDPVARQQLNDIMHPAIKKEIQKQLAHLSAQVVVLDVPLLFETGFDELATVTVVVSVSKEIQLARLMKRNGLTKAEALARIASQMSLQEKIERADYVIHNEGSFEDLEQAVTQLIKRIK